MAQRKKILFKPQEECYGCGKVADELPVTGLFSRRKFCSKHCMLTNYFKIDKEKLSPWQKDTGEKSSSQD